MKISAVFMNNSGLDLKESLLLVHPVKDQPNDQKSRQSLNEAVPGTEAIRQSPDKNVADAAKIEKARDHVHKNRVHPDDFERECPFAEPPDIDDKIKQAEKEEAEST